MWKLTVFIPAEHLENVKEALFEAGAGATAHGYDRCCWQILGQGQFRPLEGSHPFIGSQGTSETVAEYRVEMLCGEERKSAVTEALLAAHPYEQPAYDWVKIYQ